MSNAIDTTIHQAATSGDAALVQRLVEKQKTPVNIKDKVLTNHYDLLSRNLPYPWLSEWYDPFNACMRKEPQ